MNFILNLLYIYFLIEFQTPPKLTPRKTPKKLTRSATNKSVKRRRIIESDSEGAMSGKMNP